MTQTCPVCGKDFYVSISIAHKKYCTERCKLRAKTLRKKGADAQAHLIDPEKYYEVGHRPSVSQLDHIAGFMLSGGTPLPSYFTGVCVNWLPPDGVDWFTAPDGRAEMSLILGHPAAARTPVKPLKDIYEEFGIPRPTVPELDVLGLDIPLAAPQLPEGV